MARIPPMPRLQKRDTRPKLLENPQSGIGGFDDINGGELPNSEKLLIGLDLQNHIG